MSVKTDNIYGKIAISDIAIARFIEHTVLDSYGIVGFVPKTVFDTILSFFMIRPFPKGVKVKTSGDRIFIDMSVIVKYGISIKAVIEGLKEVTKYKVERFTGMIVDTINVNVVGVQR